MFGRCDDERVGVLGGARVPGNSADLAGAPEPRPGVTAAEPRFRRGDSRGGGAEISGPIGCRSRRLEARTGQSACACRSVPPIRAEIASRGP